MAKWLDTAVAVLRALLLVGATLAADVQVRGALTELVRVLLHDVGLPAPAPDAPRLSALKSCNPVSMTSHVLRSE